MGLMDGLDFIRRALFTGGLLAALASNAPAWADEEMCAPAVYENANYTVCTVDVSRMHVELFSAAPDGTPYGSFAALSGSLRERGRELVFGMNAGMYDEALKPIGLYIEAGKRMKKANTRDGYGNFHLKPNGVFYIAGNKAGVMETGAFLRSGIAADYATQSGPMLVVNGAIHPKFGRNSTSFKKRNGVGVVNGTTAVFVISEDAVTFYDFARFFRDKAGARNALFFDGTISSLHYGARSDGFFPLGPIVAVTKPSVEATQ